MEDTAETMKGRLRADLRDAMKNKRAIEAKVIRSLVAALDNAEAPPAQDGRAAGDFHRFHSGSAEVERRVLDGAEVRQILRAEILERERAAAELKRLGKTDHAADLHAEAIVAKRYVE